MKCFLFLKLINYGVIKIWKNYIFLKFLIGKDNVLIKLLIFLDILVCVYIFGFLVLFI